MTFVTVVALAVADDGWDVPINDDQEQQNYGDIDHWLEESGRRKHSVEWVASLYARNKVPPEDQIDGPGHRHLRQPGLVLLFGVAAVAYATQYFIEIQLAISALPRLIVFIAPK